MKIELKIKNMGHIPSFKNKKRVARKRNGPLFLMTDPQTKKWMDACIQSFVSQLFLQCAITEGGTSTEHLQRFLTAYVPQDDCWKIIPEIIITSQKGDDPGAIIKIESI